MSFIPNFTDPNIKQIRDHAGGGYIQGIAESIGAFGGINIGKKGIIVCGVLGVAVGFKANLEIQLPEGNFMIIHDGSLFGANQQFGVDRAAERNIPLGAKVWFRQTGYTSGSTFFYLGTS